MQCNNMLHSGRHAVKNSMQHASWDSLPDLFQLLLQLFHSLVFRQLVQLVTCPRPKSLNA